MRKLCLDMAREARHHVALVKSWLAKYPKPAADWAAPIGYANGVVASGGRIVFIAG